ncbi:MAG TPA: GNAT family N-acetyltransferase [Gemmatimonadaceae bacterium]|jgi:ribosomal protein S18 acetylase RimI-like enzyme|nr:GNAT family N-acetyltransferase [Gemmatimonadaceae bacterium]
MSVQIRPATAGDAAALSAFAAETFHATYAAFNTAENMAAYIDAAFSPERQRGEIEDPLWVVLLAVEEAAIVGYAQIAPGNGALEIKRFYIAPSRHGCGVAQVLMDAAVRSAAARGAGALWLSVWERNPRAIAFYRKVGFAETGVTTFQFGSETQRDLLMMRHLTTADRPPS